MEGQFSANFPLEHKYKNACDRVMREDKTAESYFFDVVALAKDADSKMPEEVVLYHLNKGLIDNLRKPFCLASPKTLTAFLKLLRILHVPKIITNNPKYSETFFGEVRQNFVTSRNFRAYRGRRKWVPYKQFVLSVVVWVTWREIASNYKSSSM